MRKTSTLEPLKEQLAASLKDEITEQNRKKWVQYIIENDVPLLQLADLILREKKVAMHFSWMVGELCDKVPDRVFPAVSYFFSVKDKVQFQNYDRSIAKVLWLAGVPEEIEGEAIDTLFKWLLDPKVIVSTKAYSLSAIAKMTTKYPELKNELLLVIEDQMDKSSAAFKARARMVMKEIAPHPSPLRRRGS
jgi:hypothetical protein